jgi:hypothetical protein
MLEFHLEQPGNLEHRDVATPGAELLGGFQEITYGLRFGGRRERDRGQRTASLGTSVSKPLRIAMRRERSERSRIASMRGCRARSTSPRSSSLNFDSNFRSPEPTRVLDTFSADFA